MAHRTETRRGPESIAAKARFNGIAATLQQLVNVAAIGLFSIVLARAVSVADFGVYAYAITLASIGMAVGMGGIYGLGIKSYVDNPERSGQVTTSIILIRESFSVLVYGAILLVAALSGQDSVVVLNVAIAGLAVFGKVLDVPDLWFQATMSAYISACVKIVFAVAFFGLRMLFIANEGSITDFVWLLAAEYLVTSIALCAVYCAKGPKPAFGRPVASDVRTLTRNSFPLWLSSVVNQLNLRIGVILLQILASLEAVAFYTAATRITDVIFAIPMAYATATFAVLIGAKKGTINEYRGYLQRSLTSACWMGILVGIAIACTAHLLVPLLYGAAYADSAGVLTIQAVACPFIFMSAIFSKWIIAEGTYWMSLGRYMTGLMLNLVLCLFLIPRFDVNGAAIASVVAIAASTYLFCFLRRDTRELAKMMSFAFIEPAVMIVLRVKQKV